MKAEEMFLQFQQIPKMGIWSFPEDKYEREFGNQFFVIRMKNTELRLKMELDPVLTKRVRSKTNANIIVVKRHVQESPNKVWDPEWLLIEDGSKWEYMAVEMKMDEKAFKLFKEKPGEVKYSWTEAEEERRKPLISAFVAELIAELNKRPAYRLHMVTNAFKVEYPK